jgi:hypothetical protein
MFLAGSIKEVELLLTVSGLRKIANTPYHLKDYPIPVSVPGSATQLENRTCGWRIGSYAATGS